MRLSTVFELLLIFLFLALASSRHIEKKQLKKGLTKQSINSYCKCSDLQCNCCRDFPVVPIKGPGCAALGYQAGDVLRLTMSFGDRVLRNITLAGKRPKPVCMGLPGGVTKFCGRLYNIERLDDHFKACLSLELRALDELEAGIRVSCFNFGPKGVKLEPGEPPSSSKPADDYDDDDDYDIDDDDDDDDDDEFDDDDDEYNDIESDGDYTGFAALSDQIFEGFFFPESSGNKKKKPVRPVTQEAAVEVTTKAFAAIENSTDAVTVTKSPLNNLEDTEFPSSTQGPEQIASVTPKIISSNSEVTPSKVPGMAEGSIVTTFSPVTELAITSELEKENETEDSESEEEDREPEVVQKESDSALEEEDSGEGSADEQLDENEKEFEVSEVKLENDDDEDEDDDEDDDDSEEEESAENVESAEEKDSDNILNVFFNRDDESNETERERMRKEREHLKKILPGLLELLKPSPTPPTYEIHSFPAVRSARVHRRMRLPPI